MLSTMWSGSMVNLLALKAEQWTTHARHFLSLLEANLVEIISVFPQIKKTLVFQASLYNHWISW
jgi:hypothetical protein